MGINPILLTTKKSTFCPSIFSCVLVINCVPNHAAAKPFTVSIKSVAGLLLLKVVKYMPQYVSF